MKQIITNRKEFYVCRKEQRLTVQLEDSTPEEGLKQLLACLMQNFIGDLRLVLDKSRERGSKKPNVCVNLLGTRYGILFSGEFIGRLCEKLMIYVLLLVIVVFQIITIRLYIY